MASEFDINYPSLDVFSSSGEDAGNFGPKLQGILKS